MFKHSADLKSRVCFSRLLASMTRTTAFCFSGDSVYAAHREISMFKSWVFNINSWTSTFFNCKQTVEKGRKGTCQKVQVSHYVFYICSIFSAAKLPQRTWSCWHIQWLNYNTITHNHRQFDWFSDTVTGAFISVQEIKLEPTAPVLMQFVHVWHVPFLFSHHKFILQC